LSRPKPTRVAVPIEEEEEDVGSIFFTNDGSYSPDNMVL